MDNQSMNVELFEAWRKKVFHFSLSDQMGTLVSRALELMMGVVINGDNVSNAEHFVRSLESEHKLAMERDPQSNLPVREVVYILCAGLGITIDSIIKSRMHKDLDQDETRVDAPLTDQSGNSNEESDSYVFDVEDPLAELRFPKEEPMYARDGDSDNCNDRPNSIKMEELDPLVDSAAAFGDSSDENKEEEEKVEKVPSSSIPIPTLADESTSSAAAAAAAAAVPTPQSVETSAARPKRAAAAAAAECDSPAVKRAKTDENCAAGLEVAANMDECSVKKLQCPQCEKFCKNANAIVLHLMKAHQTTPKKMGIVFLCPCGHESASNGHVRDKCGLYKSTSIINARDSKYYKIDFSPEEEHDTGDKECALHEFDSTSNNFGEEEEEETAAAAAAATVPSPLSHAATTARPTRAAAAAARMEVCSTPVSKKLKTGHQDDRSLQCPKCAKTCHNTQTLVMHLRNAHNSTPKKAEIVFLCECGNESQSNGHAINDPCGRSTSTVIIKPEDSKKYKGGGSNDGVAAEPEVAAAAAAAAAETEDGPTTSHSRCWCTACGQDFQDLINLFNHVSLAHPKNDSNICAFDDMSAHFGTH